MILNLVRHDAAVANQAGHTRELLHTVCDPFPFSAPPFDPAEFATNLVETMLAHKGLGLSAPQVGVLYRVIAVVGDPCVVMYNPRIIDASETSQELDEACLTFPGLRVKISRSRLVKVRYFLPNGEAKTETFSDLTARVIQHEVDHLDGVTILDRAVGLRKTFAQKKWKNHVRKHGGEPAQPRLY